MKNILVVLAVVFPLAALAQDISGPGINQITGDCAAGPSGGPAAITCTKSSGVNFGTAAFASTGTSGATIPLNNASNTLSGVTTISGNLTTTNDHGISGNDSGGTARQALVPRAADNSLYLDGGTGGSNLRTNNGTTVNLRLNIDGTSTLSTSFIVSGLPTCNGSSAGAFAYVTDATSPVYATTLTGGGTVRVVALCNGTSWTAH